MSTFYTEGEYFRNNPSMSIEHAPWKAKHIIKIIQKNDLNPINSICEVGCGAGEILNELSNDLSSEIRFYGYEIATAAYDRCLKIKNDRISFYLKDILQENSFIYDIVMMIDVIEHIEDYMGFLRKLKAKGKWFIFHIPLEISMNTAFRTWSLIWGRKNIGHIHYFTKDTALATLQDTGYELIDFFYTPGLIDFADCARDRMTKMLKLPRKLLFTLNQDLAVKTLGGFSLIVLAR
jgi:hypothetical protein